jgi:NADH:ubiquinone oxidoreductase subunit 6 (subunit J)
MIEIIAWAGAVFALIGGVGMLLSRSTPETVGRNRMLGIALLAMAAFNIVLATQIL